MCIAVALMVTSRCETTAESRPEVPAVSASEAGPWQALAKYPRNGPIVTASYNGRFRAEARDVSDDLGDKPTETKVFDQQGELALSYTTPGHGWFVQDVWVTDHFLVVEEINEPRYQVRIVAFDLSTAKRMVLPRPLVTEPELDASNGVVAYISGHSESRMCLQLLDLTTVQAREATCARRGEVISDVAYNAGRAVYSVIDRPNQKNRCKIVWVLGPGAEPRALPTQHRCRGWSGAVTADAVSWDEADPFSEQFAFGRAYMQSAGGDIRPTEPMIDTDSIVGCGGSFFWSTSGGGGRIDAMDRDGSISTALEFSEDQSPGLVVCADDRWLQTIVEDLSRDRLPAELVVRDLKPGR